MMPFKRLLSLFKGPAEDMAGVGVVAKRFVQAFQAHGVEPSQIQRFLPNITLDCLQSESKLLAALNHDTLFRTSELFGIRLTWLEGVDDQIYEHLGCYKKPQVILDDLNRLPRGQDGEIEFPLRVITTQMNLDYRGGGYQLLVPVVVEKLAELDDIDVCRYRIYMDGFTWDYWPARMELKAIARIVFQRLRMPVPLFQASIEEAEAISEGRMFPGAFVHGCQLTNPSLEDFALWRSESLQAKEEDELPEVFSYMEEHQLENFKFDGAEGSRLALQENTELPPLDFVSEKSLIAASTHSKAIQLPDWVAQAHSIADELDAKDASCGAQDSIRGMAKRLEKIMRERKIHGPRGRLTAATIMREALQGGKWKRKQ